MFFHKLQLPEESVVEGTELPVHVTADVMRLIGEYNFFYLRDQRIFYANGVDYDIQYKLDIPYIVTWFDVDIVDDDIYIYVATSDYGVAIYQFNDNDVTEVTSDLTGLPATKISAALAGGNNAICLEKDLVATFYHARDHLFTDAVCSGLVLHQAEKYEISPGNLGFCNITCRYNGYIRYDAIPWGVICRDLHAVPVLSQNILEHASGTTWTHTHNLGTKNLMIYAFASDNTVIDITSATLVTDTSVEIYWNEAIAGKSIVMPASGTKSFIASNSWDYTHEQGNAFVQFYDSDYNYIEPSGFIMHGDDVTVTWNEDVTGQMHIMSAELTGPHPVSAFNWDEVELSEYPLWLGQYYDEDGNYMRPYFIMGFSTEIKAEFNVPTKGFVVLKGVEDGVC